jgi:hypothetical protein
MRMQVQKKAATAIHRTAAHLRTPPTTTISATLHTTNMLNASLQTTALMCIMAQTCKPAE